MRASTPTKLSLARFAEIMGIHPLHFAQIQANGAQPRACAGLYYQWTWLTGTGGLISREEIAQAISTAEMLVENVVGWRLAPSWEVDERAIIGKPANPSLSFYAPGGTPRGYPPTVMTRWARVISGGVRNSEPLGLGAAITWTDEDNDGYFETGTVTATVPSSVDDCEAHLFYPGKGALETWRIRPITRSRAGTTITFTFRRELAVKDEFYSQVTVADLQALTVNGATDADFIDGVDVYRVYNDGSQQASFLWENVGVCGCEGEGCPTCGYQQSTGCLTVRDGRLGILAYQPATWDAENEAYIGHLWTAGRAPDQARLWYYGGMRDNNAGCPNDGMARQWEIMIAHLAAALLNRELCKCGSVEQNIWVEDMAIQKVGKGSGATQYKIQESDLANPLGTTRAAITIWRYLRYTTDDGIILRSTNV